MSDMHKKKFIILIIHHNMDNFIPQYQYMKVLHVFCKLIENGNEK